MLSNFINKNIRGLYLIARRAYAFIPMNFLRGYSFPPLSAVILLTYRCNCRCKHCFYYNEINKKKTENNPAKNELTKNELLNIIKQCKNLGVKNITFHGGEPFLRPDLIELIRYSNKNGLRTNITSNAALIDSKKAEQIVLSGLNNLCISIDGPEKIHDLIRGKGTFKKALSAISMINEFKLKYKKDSPLIDIACTLTSINSGHLSEIIESFKKIKVNSILFSGITWNSQRNIEVSKKILNSFKSENVEVGSEMMPDKLMAINPLVLLDELKKVRNLAAKYNISVYSAPFISKEIINKYYLDDSFSFKKSCNYPWISIVISPQGYVYSCIPMTFLNKNFGNLRKSSLKKIWNSEPYKRFRRIIAKSGKIPICNKCCELNSQKKLSD